MESDEPYLYMSSCSPFARVLTKVSRSSNGAQAPADRCVSSKHASAMHLADAQGGVAHQEKQSIKPSIKANGRVLRLSGEQCGPKEV